MCHAFASPTSAEYWHIGETTMRLGRFTLRSVNGANRLLMNIFQKMNHGREARVEMVRGLPGLNASGGIVPRIWSSSWSDRCGAANDAMVHRRASRVSE